MNTKQNTADPLGFGEKNLYKSLALFLPIQVRSRLACTCTFFRNQLQPQLIEEREKLFDVFPERLFRDPIFKQCPTPFFLLLTLISRARSSLKVFFSNCSDGRWQLAALCGLEGALEQLLGDKIHLTKDILGFGVMHYYALGGHIKLLQIYWQTHCPNFSALNDPSYLLIKLALTANQFEIVSLLIDNYQYSPLRKTVNQDDSLLHLVAQGGGLECAKLLIAKGADISYGRCLAIVAAEHGHFALCDYFISLGLDPCTTKEDQYEFILKAIAHNQLSRALKIIDVYEIDPKLVFHNDMNILNCAAQHGHLAIAKTCIDAGWFDKNRLFAEDTNLLHHAAMNGQSSFVINAIREFNLDPHVVNKQGYNVLHYFAMNGNWRGFRRVRDTFFADQPLMLSSQNENMAHLAAKYGNLEFLKNLVSEYGSPCLKGQTKNKSTILNKACASENPEVIVWLVREQGYSARAVSYILEFQDPHNYLQLDAIMHLLQPDHIDLLTIKGSVNQIAHC